MAQKEVHFEVFRRHGAKGAWILHDVISVREKALKMAADLMATEKATGVKVVKETYDGDTGDYLTLKIFEDGHTKMKVDPAAEDVPSALPCFKPDDLYSYHARATLSRLLRDFLARQKVTITELIHRADCLETLEATGTTYQFAVQKIAVAQAGSTSVPVQQIMKNLNELATKAIHRVYRDARRNYFPLTNAGGFGPLAEKLAVEGDGSYVFNGALARHLAASNGWNDKLVMLLAVMHEAPVEGPGRVLLLGAVDNLVAEILAGSAALHELIGESDDLGQAMTVLVELFLGQIPQGEDIRAGLVALTEQFAADGLPKARIAIGNRIIAELKSTRRLRPASLIDELTLLRRIANRLVLCDRKYMSHEDLIAAFTLRSRRIVAHDSIAEYVGDLAAPDAKIERLLQIEENIIGAENKRQLGGTLQQILTSTAFEAHFQSNQTPVMMRLKRLAELQARVRRSSFQDNQREIFADWLDRVANEVDQRSKALRALHDNLPGPVERALAILKLCASGALTEGRMTTKARDIVLLSLGQPGFLAGYLSKTRRADATESSDSDKAMAELMQLLSGIGISREMGLKSIAA
jgi:hypothetical protein